MLLHYIVQVFLSDFMAHFVHCVNNVFFCYCATAICVKLIKKRIQFFLIKESLDIHCGHQKFGVINFLISHVINFIDDILDLLIRNI